MTPIRLYFPLIGFVLPTLAVGYGIVIPRSCIAGINELSIGFGATVLGAIVAYVGGQRVLSPRICTKPPLTVRLARLVNRQAASPHGIAGSLLGAWWRRESASLNAEVIALLDAQSGHRVLELGPATGQTLRALARRVRAADGGVDGHVVGIDVSERMVHTARARNRGTVAEGIVDVRCGTAHDSLADVEFFDRIVSVHCIYFWEDAPATLRRLAAALRAGGRLVIAFRPNGVDLPARFRDPIYRFPETKDVVNILEQAGLTRVATVHSETSPVVVLLSAEKP